MPKKYLTFFLLAILLILWGWLFYHNTFNAPFERDEGEYAYSAQLLRSGGMPYQDTFLQKPPMIVYTYLVGLSINPTAVWPPRLIAFVFTLSTAVLVGLIAKKEYGWEAGLLATFLFIPMNSFPYLTSYAANTERFMQLPMMGALTLYVYYRDKATWKIWFWAGLLASLAFFYKQLCSLIVAFIFLYWLCEAGGLFPPLKERATILIKKIFGALEKKDAVLREHFTTENFRALKNLLPALLGATTGFLLVCGYFLAHGAFHFIWNESFVFNRYYIAQNNFFTSIYYYPVFWQMWPLFCFFLVWYALTKLPRKGFYLTLFILGVLSAATSPIRHYFLLAMPFWSIIVGAALGDIIISLAGKYRQSRLRKAAIFSTGAIIALAAAVIPVWAEFGKTPDQMNLWVYGVANPFDEARLVSQKVKEFTGKNARIFVAGSEPEIYYYSQRKCTTRFDITYPFTIKTPFWAEFQKQAVSELEKNPPAAIVYTQLDSSGFPKRGTPQILPSAADQLLKAYQKQAINKLINDPTQATLYADLLYENSPKNNTPQIISNYVNQLIKKDYTFAGAFIRRPNLSGDWKTGALSDTEMSKATLLLYLKK